MEIDLEKIKFVHCIGIGGIGLSAIAKLMFVSGKKVTGSDTGNSPVIESLKTSGIKIFEGHSDKNIDPKVDLVIYTIAVSERNPEIIEAKKRNIPIISYPQMLALVSKNMETIAISGTHGKTTTTAMLAKIMIDAKLDPTVIVGSLLKDFSSNLIVGKSQYFLVEACEYKRSFLSLYPTVLIITNIDLDHLDYYKNLVDIQSAFREIAERVPENGAVICDTSGQNIKPVIANLKCRVIDYMDFFDENIKINFPGKHNILNASAALAVSNFLKVDMVKSKVSLENFNGTWRRFEYHGQTNKGTILYDDYAHHPEEIKSTLSGLKIKYPDKKINIFFQPHLYSRTKDHLNEFAKSFIDADRICILPIYAAREEFDPTISSEVLVKKLLDQNLNASYLENFSDAIKIIESLGNKSLAITMGAGDIYKILDGIKKSDSML